jgi:hypothetical protein
MAYVSNIYYCVIDGMLWTTSGIHCSLENVIKIVISTNIQWWQVGRSPWSVLRALPIDRRIECAVVARFEGFHYMLGRSALAWR